MRNAGIMATVAFFGIVLGFVTVVHPQQGPPNDPPGGLQAQVDALLARVEILEELTQFQIVVQGEMNGLAGPHLIFEGVNLHIESGSGSTDDGGTGLGNLVVGYNEAPPGLGAGERGGSHNLIVGPEHRYASTGGFVAGFRNTISGLSASVSGGVVNTASGVLSSVSGGNGNTASGLDASVSGGKDNTASGDISSVSGGEGNTASGFASSVSGGAANMASFEWCSVSGGEANTASGIHAGVSGGFQNTASGDYSSVSGGRLNNAIGENSSVSGGATNTASGFISSVSGGS